MIGQNRHPRGCCTLEREASTNSDSGGKSRSGVAADELCDDLGQRLRIAHVAGKDHIRHGRESTLGTQAPDGYAGPHLTENGRPLGAESERADVARGDATL